MTTSCLDHLADDHYPVEDGVPIPPPKAPFPSSRAFYTRFPFAIMEVGQSFVIPHTDAAAVTNIYVKLNKQKRFGRRFVARSLDEGVRVWRTK